jgi:hypothetical protein
MRNWGYLPSSEDLALLAQAAGAFREKWASISPPWLAGFDGTLTDVRTISSRRIVAGNADGLAQIDRAFVEAAANDAAPGAGLFGFADMVDRANAA